MLYRAIALKVLQKISENNGRQGDDGLCKSEFY